MSPHPRVGRDHILDKAEELFTEHGYKSASIRDIARECGVTNAAIYYHFPNKESLFADVMQRHAECLQEKMTSAGEKIESPRERITAILQAYIDVIAGQHAPLFMLRRNAKHLKGHGKHRGEFMQAISQPLVNTIEHAQEREEIKEKPNAKQSAAMMLGMLHGLAQQHRAEGIEDLPLSEEDIRMVVNFFWDSMKTDL